METGIVTIQEPASTKTNIEEAPVGVILDHSSMKVDKVNLSTVLDDELTDRDCGNITIPGAADVVNGSGNKETEESEGEKGEAMKTISVVEDCKIVKEKASETEKDEQGSIFVHETESFKKNTEDAKIILSDVTLQKEKDNDIIEKSEEVSVEKAVLEEDQTETKHSPEQVEEIGNISKVLTDTTPVKVDDNDNKKSLNSASEEIPINTDEVKEEKDLRSVETSVNGTEAEQKATVSVEEISKNGENIVNETVTEEETATDGESIHDIETTKRVLLEVKKEEEEAEMKEDAEPSIKTIVEDANIVSNEETTAHESKSLKENEEPVEAIKNSNDAEQISREVTVDKEKEEDITQNTEEVQESVRVIETPTIQRENIESKASLDNEEEIVKISKDTEKHEHVLVRDIPQGETLVTEAETVDTSTVQEAEILKTNIIETEANSAIGGEEKGQETKENTKTSLDLKEDNEQEETEIVKTINSSDEVRSCDVQVEEFSEHIEPRSLEIKDESHGREESNETVQEESTKEKHENLLDVPSTESEKYQDNEPETALVTNTESKEKFEETSSDLLEVDKDELKDEKTKADQVDGTQIMEEQRGLDSNGAEAEQVDKKRTDETDEIPVVKLIVLPDVEESVEQMQKPSIESPSEVSEETSKIVDEKVEEKPEEEVVLHQEGQMEGSNGLDTKEETVSVPERSVIDLTPLKEESLQLNEQEKDTKLEKHETTNEEVKSDEVIDVSSALPSKELDGETVVEAENIESIKENEEEQVADKILKSLETVETVESHSSLPSSSEEQEHGTVFEKIEDEKLKEKEPMVQIKSEDDATKIHERHEDFSKAVETKETMVVQAEQTRDIETSLTEKCSMDQTEPEEQVKEACSRDEKEKEISRNSENIVNETYVLHSAEAAAEEETATNVESPLHDVKTTKRVLLEVEKEAEEVEMKTEEIETVKIVVEDSKIVNNEETTAHDSKSLKEDHHQEENEEPIEAIKNSDDAEQISLEVTVDKEKEEVITQNTEEVKESSRLIETPTIQGEKIESKVSPDHEEEIDKISKDIEEHEHVLGRDIPQCETLDVEAVEAKEDTKPSLDKEDKEQEVAETAKTVIFSDEVRTSNQVDVQAEELGEYTKPRSSEVKDESHGREESVEVKSKETVQDESTEEKHENLLDVLSTESEKKYQDNEPETTIVANTDIQEKFEETPSDPARNVDKEKLKDKKIIVDQVDGTKIMEDQRGLDSNGEEAEQIDRNRTDETEESPVAKLVTFPDEESFEKMKKPALESPSEVSEETKKTIDDKIEEISEEETVSLPESKELGEQAHEERTLIDLTPLQEESSQPNEQEKESMLEKHEPTNEEVSSESFMGENAESVEATENSDDSEKISSEVIGDREKEEDITQKAEEVQESPRIIETPREDTESKASLELKEKVDQSSKDTEELELVLGSDIPQCETLEAEAVVDTSTTVQEAAILKTLETNINETEAVHSAVGGAEDGQETKEDTKTSLDLKEDKEQKEAETLKTVIFSDEVRVRPSDQVDAQEEEIGEHTGTCSSEIKDESERREESVEVKSKETVLDESSEEKDVNLLDVRSGESEKFQDNEPETTLISTIESQEKSEEISLDLALKDELKDEKTKAGQVDGTQTIEVQRGLNLDEPEAEKIDQNITDESPVENLVAVEGTGLDETPHNQTLLDVESVEKVHELPLESPSEILEETSKTVDEKIEDKPKEEVTLDQEGQEEGSYGLQTKEETVSVPEESCLPNEQENETMLQEKNEPTKEEVSNDQQSLSEETTDEVIRVLSAAPPAEREGETVVEAEKIGDKKVDEEEQVADKIQRGLETVETVEPNSSLQEHGTVSEKTDGKKVKEAEPTGDMSEKGLEISETTHLSLPYVDQEKDIKDFDEEIKIPSFQFPLDEQEKVTSTEKEETKENETVEAKKGDEEITVSTSKTAENVYIQQEELGKLEAPKLEESKEDKSQDIFETTEAIEATSDQTLPIETSQADSTPSSELMSEQEDQTLKQVEEIHNEEEKEAHKLQAEEILPTEIIPRESSDGALVSMLASKDDDQVIRKEDKCADDVRETKDTQEEQSVSVETEEIVGETKPKEPEDDHVETPASPIILEKHDNETLIAEAKKEDEDINETETTMALDTSGTSATSENVCIKQEEFKNHEAPKVEESKEEKSQEIAETATAEAIEAKGDQTLPIETSQADQTLSSELVSELDDQTSRQVKELHEEETKEEHKFEATDDRSLLVETSQECQTPSSDVASGLDDQTTKQVEEVHDEETKEEHKLQFAVDQILPVETSQADQTPSVVKEYLEEETNVTHKAQAEDTVPRESFSEAPVSILASGEDKPVTPQEGNYAGDGTQDERHVSAETEEKVVETKPKEPEAEGTEKSDDQVETSTKLTEVEDENTKKTDIEVAELTDYSTGEAEHEDENSSTLPVVEILKGLHNTLETERELNDSASSGENVIIEPAESVQKTGNAEVKSNEKDCASDINEANMLQQDESGETEKVQEEHGLVGKSLPMEELNLQEEDKEEVKVQDGISKAFEVSVKEKLQEEETREIAEKQEEQDASLQEEHPRDFEVSKTVGDNSDQVIESELPEDQTQTEQKTEIHETVKGEEQIVDFKDVKKNEEVHDEKLEDLSTTTDTKETFSSEVKKDQEDVSELGVDHDFASLQVEKAEEPQSVLENDEDINEVVTSKKQITDPVGAMKKAEHESNEEHVEPQAISDDTKTNNESDCPTKQGPKDQREEVTSSALLDDQDLSVKKPSELIQPHQSPNQVEVTSFEVKKAKEDKNEETGDALIINETVQVKDQPKDFEASVTDKEKSKQEQKSNELKDVQEDNGTNVKQEVHDDEVRCDSHDSVVEPKEKTGLIEEKKEVEHVETELEDAIKHGVLVEEKNNRSEKIEREAKKEINQEESKETNTVQEEIREEEKETTQECFNNMKNTNDTIEKTELEIRDIDSLSSVSKTQDNSEQKEEVPKVESLKTAEELQQKDEESENKKDLFSEVKESEPTRKSLSDLIQNVKGTTKNEDTTETHIEEEPKTEEEENEDGDHEHNKDDKTSPDSLVMVEAKDTVSIIKTHKKSQGILSGVGSKVKHSISKVKKVLTGKSSHTTKPSSPK